MSSHHQCLRPLRSRLAHHHRRCHHQENLARRPRQDLFVPPGHHLSSRHHCRCRCNQRCRLSRCRCHLRLNRGYHLRPSQCRESCLSRHRHYPGCLPQNRQCHRRQSPCPDNRLCHLCQCLIHLQCRHLYRRHLNQCRGSQEYRHRRNRKLPRFDQEYRRRRNLCLHCPVSHRRQCLQTLLSGYKCRPCRHHQWRKSA